MKESLYRVSTIYDVDIQPRRKWWWRRIDKRMRIHYPHVNRLLVEINWLITKIKHLDNVYSCWRSQKNRSSSSSQKTDAELFSPSSFYDYLPRIRIPDYSSNDVFHLFLSFRSAIKMSTHCQCSACMKKNTKLLCGCVLGMGAYLLKDLLWNHNNTYFYYTQHTARWNKSKSIILLLSVGRPSIKTSSVQYIWLTSVRKCSNLINLLINLHNVFTMGSERIWVIHHKKS